MDINLIVKNILNEFMRQEENILHAEKLFVAHSVLKWAFENSSNEKQITFYVEQIKKYLRNELTLVWKEGKIRIFNRR